MEIFSKRLRKSRLERGEKQAEVADMLGVSGQSYSAYELGREPKYEHLATLTKHYGTTADYLLGLVDAPTETEEIETFAVSSGIPVNDLPEEAKQELLSYAKYLLAREKEKSI